MEKSVFIGLNRSDSINGGLRVTGIPAFNYRELAIGFEYHRFDFRKVGNTLATDDRAYLRFQ